MPAPAHKQCTLPLCRTRSAGSAPSGSTNASQVSCTTGPQTPCSTTMSQSPTTFRKTAPSGPSPLTSLFYGNLPEDVAIAVTDDPTFAFPSSAQLNSKAQTTRPTEHPPHPRQPRMDAPHYANRRCSTGYAKTGFAPCNARQGRGPTTANATSPLGTGEHPSAATGPTPVFYTPGASAVETAMRAGGHDQATFDPSNFDWRAFVLTDDTIRVLTSADLPPNYLGCLGCARP